MKLRTATSVLVALALLQSLNVSRARAQNAAPRQRMAPPPAAAPAAAQGIAPPAARQPAPPQPNAVQPAYEAAAPRGALPAQHNRIVPTGGQGPVPGQPAAPPPPPGNGLPQLAPLQQAELDHILSAWEAASDKIKTLTTTFFLWEYNTAFSANAKPGEPPKPINECVGELHFAAPDQGYYKVTKGEPQHWVCDGKSMYEFDFKQKRLKEYKLPPELQGKAITNGPLPFVFGAKKGALKNRYWMRVITPPDDQQNIWIEAWPLWQQDAANFHHVEVILNSSTMLPSAIRMYDPNPQMYKVYAFNNTKMNGTFAAIKDFFSRPMTPFGWKYEEVEPPADALPKGDPPAAADARGRAAAPPTPKR